MTKLIELKNINKSYQNGDQTLQVLKDIHLDVEEGEFLAIMGPSGSGKSTLMNIIGLLDRPTSGEYRLEGEEVGNLSEKKLAQVRNEQIGFVFQQFFLLSKLNAFQNVELPLIYAGVNPSKRKELAEQFLKKVELDTRMHHLPSELSGGQKAKVLLLSMSLSGANVLILDEPTRNFSPLSGPVIRKMLREFPGAIISISHDRKYIDEVCDKIYELDYSGLRNL